MYVPTTDILYHYIPCKNDPPKGTKVSLYVGNVLYSYTPIMADMISIYMCVCVCVCVCVCACVRVCVRVGFYVLNHTDCWGSPLHPCFDGLNGELAHAFLPPRGEIHFDNQELWILGRSRFSWKQGSM